MIAALVGDQVGQCWEIDDASSALRGIRAVPPLSEVRPAAVQPPRLTGRSIRAAVPFPQRFRRTPPILLVTLGRASTLPAPDASRVVE